MEFLTKEIGKKISQEIKSLKSLKIVVAYFLPDYKLLENLKKIKSLEIIVSDDFLMINPYNLEMLENNKAIVRYFPSRKNSGKLHSKVYYGERKNGYKFLIVTSANFTYQGMFSNIETSIIINSKFNKYKNIFFQFESWYSQLKKDSEKINYQTAKKIYDTRTISISNKYSEKRNKGNCWILKTTAGGNLEKDYWDFFKSESVVAIGWEKISMDLQTNRKDEVTNQIKKEYPDHNPLRIYSKINNFYLMEEGDFIIMIRGYTPNQKDKVFLYGIAQISKLIGFDKESNWWCYKHRANIFPIETEYPKELFTSSFQKNSLMQALHKTDINVFKNLIKNLEIRYNTKVEL